MTPTPLRAAAAGRLALLLALLAGVPGGASAQNAGTDGGPGVYRQVARACDADYRQLCSPPLPDADGRQQALCLKYLKSDLSLGCRRAIEAATRP